MRIESQILKFLLILCPTSVIFFPGMAAKRRFPQMAGHFPAEFLRRPLRLRPAMETEQSRRPALWGRRAAATAWLVNAALI